MGWYKQSQTVDFVTRNVYNKKISYLKSLIEVLEKTSKIVFQSAKWAQTNNSKILNGKKISSYPRLEFILAEADTIVYDSPWRFQNLCKEAIMEAKKMVFSLIKQRNELTAREKNEFKKGWI